MKLTVTATLVTLFMLVGSRTFAQTVGVSAGANTATIVASACQVPYEPCNLDMQTGVTIGVFVILRRERTRPFIVSWS